VQCSDGDPTCDQDGVCNGTCQFAVSLCLNQSGDPACVPPFPPQGLKAVRVRGPAKRLGLTPPALDSADCGPALQVPVELRRRGRRPGKKKLKVVAISPAKPKRDPDVLKLACLPNPDCVAPPTVCENPSGGPTELVYTIADTGTDLDTGQSGISHNFPIIAGARLSMCLSDCDGSTDSVCQASGPTGQGTVNGATLGPPLPLFASNIAVCVVNNFVDPAVQGVYDVATGTFDGTATPIRLNSEVFQTNRDKVCPECRNNRCDSGPRMGAACQVEGSVRVRNDGQGVNQVYQLSSSCPPGPPQGSRTGTVSVTLPLTTGTATMPGTGGGSPVQVCPGQTVHDVCGSFSTTCSVPCGNVPDTKGGMNQWCCGDAQSTPCFPTAANSAEPNHTITREGAAVAATPPWPDPTYPKTATDAKVAAVFCIGDTGEPAINVVAGLPGPGAVIFNGTQEVRSGP
jgi:hypothetical protein